MFTHTSSAVQSAVIQLLLAEHPALLHRDEIRREIGDHRDVDDALEHFARLGLVHSIGEFFWTSRTAMAAEEATSAHVLMGHDADQR